MGAHEYTSPSEKSTSKPRSRKRRITVAAALTGALVAGVLALTVPAVAQTDSADNDTGTDDGGTAVDTSTTGGDTVADGIEERLTEALGPLVTDGTITEDQRDAVIEALLAARLSAGSEENPGWHRGQRHGAPHASASAGELAELLALTPQELATRLRAGDTLADLAEDAGTETGAVVDLLVEAATGRVDAAVEASRLESDDRETCITAITASITARVNGEDGDRSAVGNSCAHDDGGDERRRGRGALRRLQFWR